MSFLRDKTRIGGILDDLRNEEFSRISPSRNYRISYELDFNKKISDSFFFDRGREKDFRNFPTIKNEFQDAFFEIILYDRKKDPVIDEFLTQIEQKFSEKWNTLLKELKRKPSSFSQNSFCELISEVSSFFGGKDPLLNTKTKEAIEKIQEESGRKNVVLLGQLKGHGLCRHRALLFKIICDLLNIRCKLVRGWLVIKGKKESHTWNVIQVSNELFIVDCMICPHPIAAASFQHFQEEVISKKRLHEQTIIEEKCVNFFKSQFDPSGGGKVGDSIRQKIVFTNDRTVIYQLTIKKENAMFQKGSKVAVKVTRVESSVPPGKQNLSLIYAQKEASIIKSLNHENIVGYYCSYLHKDSENDDEEAEGESDDDDDDDVSYFCLFLESMQTNGKKFLQNNIKKKLSEKSNEQAIESLIFLLHAARGLRYLHDLGYLHLDFKLSNILVALDDTKTKIRSVKLIDFAGSKEKNVGLFSDTVFAATPGYMAPEVEEFISKFKKKNIRSYADEGVRAEFPFDESVDIYSFGKVMLEFTEYLRFCPTFESIAKECTLEKETKRRPKLDFVIAQLRNILEYLDTEEKERMMKSKVDSVENLERRLESILSRFPSIIQPTQQQQGEQQSEGGIVSGIGNVASSVWKNSVVSKLARSAFGSSANEKIKGNGRYGV